MGERVRLLAVSALCMVAATAATAQSTKARGGASKTATNAAAKPMPDSAERS